MLDLSSFLKLMFVAQVVKIFVSLEHNRRPLINFQLGNKMSIAIESGRSPVQSIGLDFERYPKNGYHQHMTATPFNDFYFISPIKVGGFMSGPLQCLELKFELFGPFGGSVLEIPKIRLIALFVLL